MTRQFLKITALSTALLLTTASAHALSVGVTGTSGSSSVSANVGSGTGSLATVNSTGSATTADVNLGGVTNADDASGVTGDTATVNVGTGSGALATVDNNGNLVDGTSATDASINLGGLLTGLGLTHIGGTGVGGGTTVGGIQTAVASLSTDDRRALAVRCRNVLANPGIYNRDVIGLCRLIARM